MVTWNHKINNALINNIFYILNFFNKQFIIY